MIFKIVTVPMDARYQNPLGAPKNFIAFCLDKVPVIKNCVGSIDLEHLFPTYGKTEEEAVESMKKQLREHLKRMKCKMYSVEG